MMSSTSPKTSDETPTSSLRSNTKKASSPRSILEILITSHLEGKKFPVSKKQKESSNNVNLLNSSPIQQQPSISMNKDLNIEQQAAKSSISLEVPTTSSQQQNNPLQKSTKIQPTDSSDESKNKTKPKTKRNSSSLSSSLRRLIALTFNRGSSATSSTSTTTTTTKTYNNQKACSERKSSKSQASISKRDKSPHKQSGSKQKRVCTTNSSKKNSLTSDQEASNSTPAPIDWSPPTAEIAEIDGKAYVECPLCVLLVSESSTPYLASCRHRVCLDCMQRYITTEINHSRLNITCPICSEPLHPNTIKDILQNESYYLKYESFMLRRVLAAEPDARWCPAPDCGYVVLANGCASCPKLVCGRDGCNTSFCYHCKQEWHPNQTCSAASIQRNKRMINSYNITDFTLESARPNQKTSKSSQPTSIRADDIKECPVCASRIIKMNDGSCNHMTCSICETEFCWLCMKEISDLHYFSPSGCTFWGKKPWSRKKKLLWQLGMLVGAPICIILIAGIAVPAIVIGFSVWTARKLHNRLERKPFSRYRKNAIITGGVLLSFAVSPIISAVTLAIGIPMLLFYVYGVVPLSLCRSSGGCLSATPSLANLQQEFQAPRNSNLPARDGISIDTAMSHKLGDPSIGETSLYLSNISLETNSIGHLTTVEREDRESASNAALAGSIISTTADDGNSTRALAGSIMSKESGYMLIPAEVHSNSSKN